MAQTIEFPTQFIMPYQPDQTDENSRWVCMDDRYALLDGLYRQIGGGAAGIGIDWAIARELGRQRRGYSSETAEVVAASGPQAPAQILGGLATAEGHRHGIELYTHESCAAELGALMVAQAINDNPEEVFLASRQVKPDLEPSDFEPVQDAFHRGLVNYIIMEPGEGAYILDNGTVWNGRTIPPVRRVGLVAMDHVAQDIGINHQSDVAFDVRSALESKNPAYHVSFGDLPEIHTVINRILPVKYEDFETVSAIRHGAISLLLPRPGGEPLRIHSIAA